MRKRICFVLATFGLIAGMSGILALPALACGGLIGPNGAVNLTRTATLAAHHNGVEHYVTAFTYAGGGGKFGSIVPLPAMPSKVEKGGAWTLQRLQRETNPQPVFAAADTAGAKRESAAVEVYKTKIDALDITVLKGGGKSVGLWASDHGFRLPPDTPAVLDFYAARSPYFMAAVFDSAAAAKRGQNIGDGTPIHITMPLASPWVPLRILGLGKQASERIDADVYLLTDRKPSLLPSGDLAGYTVERQVPASDQLMTDLRTDRGMDWMPKSGMTLTHLVVGASAAKLRYDLAINDNGGTPSAIRAGLAMPATPPPATPVPTVKPTPTVAPTPIGSPVLAQPLAAPVSDTRSMWPLVLAISLVVAGALGALGLSRKLRSDESA